MIQAVGWPWSRMIDNQHGRRNLTDGWKFELLLAKKKLLEVKGKANKKGRGKVLSNIDKTNTREQIAAELGWSTGKVAMAGVPYAGKGEPNKSSQCSR